MEVHISTLKFTAWNSHQPWVHYATSCRITSWLVAGRYPVHTSTWNPPISMEGCIVLPIPFRNIPNKIPKQVISFLTQCHNDTWLSGCFIFRRFRVQFSAAGSAIPTETFCGFLSPQAIATTYFCILYSSTFIVILYILQLL